VGGIVPRRALRYFVEDIARAEALVALAEGMPRESDEQQLVRDDVLRSAWMFAVGAMDAYYSDAYADLLGGTLICLQRQPLKADGTSVRIPSGILQTPLPVSMFMKEYPDRENWRWRMGARGRIERQNFLQLEDEVQKLINPFMLKKRGLFAADSFDRWIVGSGNRKKLLGITSAAYARLSPQLKGKARKEAKDAVLQRMKKIVQRRHDCIHNCDRPDNAPQNIHSIGTLRNVVDHVRYVVLSSDRHIEAEYPSFLKDCGFSGVTISGIGYQS